MIEILERTVERLKEATENAPKISISKKNVLLASEITINRCVTRYDSVDEKEAFFKLAKSLEKKLVFLLFMKQDEGLIAYNDFTSVMSSLMNSLPITDDLDEMGLNMIFANDYVTGMTAAFASLPPEYMKKVAEIQNEFIREMEEYEKRE